MRRSPRLASGGRRPCHIEAVLPQGQAGEPSQGPRVQRVQQREVEAGALPHGGHAIRCPTWRRRRRDRDDRPSAGKEPQAARGARRGHGTRARFRRLASRHDLAAARRRVGEAVRVHRQLASPTTTGNCSWAPTTSSGPRSSTRLAAASSTHCSPAPRATECKPISATASSFMKACSRRTAPS